MFCPERAVPDRTSPAIARGCCFKGVVIEMSAEKIRKLIEDLQRDIGAHLPPASGISEHQLPQQLSSSLDRQQGKEAMRPDQQDGRPDDDDPAGDDDISPEPTKWWTEPEFFGTMWKLKS